MKKRSLSLVLAALVALTIAPPSTAAPAFAVLGTDAELDSAPSFDLTGLSVRRVKKNLEIRIDVNLMTPPWGSAVPLLPGVQWTFDVKGRTFVAEAYTDPEAGPGFLLFEQKGGAFTQVMDLKGTYDWQDGFVSMKVPLKAIAAKRGTRISGTGKKGTQDVDFHVHAGTTYYADYLTTTKDFVVP
jgi:hypothetical protein